MIPAEPHKIHPPAQVFIPLVENIELRLSEVVQISYFKLNSNKVLGFPGPGTPAQFHFSWWMMMGFAEKGKTEGT